MAAAAGSHDRAHGRLEDAVAAFETAGAPFEAAHARLELAETLRALGLEQAARVVSASAQAALTGLGAATIVPASDGGPLSQREREVLALVSRARQLQRRDRMPIAEEMASKLASG